MKKSARAAGKQLRPEERDQGTGNWLYINSPDDLFKYNIEINFEKLGITNSFLIEVNVMFLQIDNYIIFTLN